MKGRCVLNSSQANSTPGNTQNTGQVRMMLILDKQANGTVPFPREVLEDSALFGAAPTIYDFINISNAKRFQIIKTWNFNFNAVVFQENANAASATPASYASSKVHRDFDYYKKCDIIIDYARETTGFPRTVPEIRSNNLFVLAFSLNDVRCALQFHWRIRYNEG